MSNSQNDSSGKNPLALVRGAPMMELGAAASNEAGPSVALAASLRSARADSGQAG